MAASLQGQDGAARRQPYRSGNGLQHQVVTGHWRSWICGGTAYDWSRCWSDHCSWLQDRPLLREGPWERRQTIAKGQALMEGWTCEPRSIPFLGPGPTFGSLQFKKLYTPCGPLVGHGSWGGPCLMGWTICRVHHGSWGTPTQRSPHGTLYPPKLLSSKPTIMVEPGDGLGLRKRCLKGMGKAKKRVWRHNSLDGIGHRKDDGTHIYNTSATDGLIESTWSPPIFTLPQKNRTFISFIPPKTFSQPNQISYSTSPLPPIYTGFRQPRGQSL